VSGLKLRPYSAADEDAAIELWRRTWQAARTDLDFTARLAWWRERWRSELVPACTIVVAEIDADETAVETVVVEPVTVEPVAAGPAVPVSAGRTIGFVTVDARTGYLDQIVVAPEAWGSPAAPALLAAAKRIAPAGLDLDVNQDNARAIRFYEKHGFKVSGSGVNPRSSAPIYRMSWRG
jgi:putative acetyltransferase